MDVSLDRVDGLLDDQFDADRRCQVHDDIGAIDMLCQQLLVLDAVDDVVEAGLTL